MFCVVVSPRAMGKSKARTKATDDSAAKPKPKDVRTSHHINICRDAHGTKVCEAQKKDSCNLKRMRRFCARTCDTCTALTAPVQIAWLMDGELPIPEEAEHILVEVGASDRNTVDEELLPRLPNAFLVTAEPWLRSLHVGLAVGAPPST